MLAKEKPATPFWVGEDWTKERNKSNDSRSHERGANEDLPRYGSGEMKPPVLPDKGKDGGCTLFGEATKRKQTVGIEIDTAIENGRTVLSLSGRLTIGRGTETLRSAIQDALDQGVGSVVVDLQSVSIIDSTAIGELAAAHVFLAKRGVTLEIRGLGHLNFPDFPDFPNFPTFPDGFAY